MGLPGDSLKQPNFEGHVTQKSVQKNLDIVLENHS